MNLAILGAGAWGTVLGELARRNGHPVVLWSRRSERSLPEVVAAARLIISAVSIKGVPDVAEQVRQLELGGDRILVTATKGLDAATTCTASQLWANAVPQMPQVVFSGPNLAKEIHLGLPAATVVSSQDVAAAQTVQKVFASDRFRVYTNDDPLGTELGGTLKNVIAIAVGVCDGLQLGTNAKSALITRALAELIRIGSHLGGQTDTFFGLSGLGDMLATCSSPLSRNYQVGYRLAQGQSLEDALADIGETAEGVNTANVLYAIANREQIPMPIAHQVYLLLNRQITPRQAVEALMERDLKSEAYRPADA